MAIVIPQTIVTLTAGPWDELFGGGNAPAFYAAAVFGFVAAVVAVWKLPVTAGVPRKKRGLIANEWGVLI